MSLDFPKISIVTPSFNQGQFIEQTILSVLNQNYPNLQYIIIDGGSTDNTIDILKKYEDRIDYWVSEKDSGQSEAINKGLKLCDGEIFNWLNSDDYYEPNALLTVAEIFTKNKNCRFVSGFENYFFENGNESLQKGTYILDTVEATIELCEITQPSTFFRLNDVLSVSGVSDDLHYIMDGELWIKLIMRFGLNDFFKIDKTLVNFRIHESSKTVSNQLVNNFLFERASIICDLQNFVGVPEKIIQYYRTDVYCSPKIYNLDRSWHINPKITSSRKLKMYFIHKYIIKQFRRNNPKNIWWALQLLWGEGMINYFFLKNFIKLIFKRS